LSRSGSFLAGKRRVQANARPTVAISGKAKTSREAHLLSLSPQAKILARAVRRSRARVAVSTQRGHGHKGVGHRRIRRIDNRDNSGPLAIQLDVDRPDLTFGLQPRGRFAAVSRRGSITNNVNVPVLASDSA